MQDQIINELVHFLQGPGVKSFLTIISDLRDGSVSWCPFVHEKKKGITNTECYVRNERVKYLVALCKRYATTLMYFCESAYLPNALRDAALELENPELNGTHQDFVENIDRFISLAKSSEEYLKPKITGLSCLECQRLDEAINCIQVNCFLASTVMAVSATEARLHYLLSRKNKTLYNKHFKDATLGQLITLFDPNQYKDAKFKSAKKLVPQRHTPLLSILNTYRVYAAHPIASKLDHKIAESVLNLVFAFLTDPDVKILDKALLHRKA